jgi:hypothetical protein
MSKLIKFIKGDGTPVLINPDFIQEVSGSDAGTVIIVKKEDSDGQLVSYLFPIPVSTAVEMIHQSAG